MDIKLQLSGDSLYHDMTISSNDIANSDNLETAVIISILTDIGWWADQTPTDTRHSRLYLLFSEKLTEQTIRTAKIYLQECLKWLVDDMVAQSVSVSTFKHNSNTLGFTIDITNRLNQTKSTKYYLNWESQKLSVGL